MKIYEVIADKRSEFCFSCPLNDFITKAKHLDCGVMKIVMDGEIGWKVAGRVPDDRCLIKTIDKKIRNKMIEMVFKANE